jgi:hypothetical protein
VESAICLLTLVNGQKAGDQSVAAVKARQGLEGKAEDSRRSFLSFRRLQSAAA